MNHILRNIHRQALQRLFFFFSTAQTDLFLFAIKRPRAMHGVVMFSINKYFIDV